MTALQTHTCRQVNRNFRMMTFLLPMRWSSSLKLLAPFSLVHTWVAQFFVFLWFQIIFSCSSRWLVAPWIYIEREDEEVDDRQLKGALYSCATDRGTRLSRSMEASWNHVPSFSMNELRAEKGGGILGKRKITLLACFIFSRFILGKRKLLTKSFPKCFASYIITYTRTHLPTAKNKANHSWISNYVRVIQRISSFFSSSRGGWYFFFFFYYFDVIFLTSLKASPIKIDLLYTFGDLNASTTSPSDYSSEFLFALLNTISRNRIYILLFRFISYHDARFSRLSSCCYC